MVESITLILAILALRALDFGTIISRPVDAPRTRQASPTDPER